MWVASFMPHPGSLPFKKWLTSVFAAFAVALLYTLAFGTVTHAADASWDNGSIRYNDEVYKGPQTANGDTSNGLRLANGVQYYYNDNNGQRKIVYFDSNQDPNDATKAHFVTYNFSPPDKYTNQSSPTEISLDKNPQATGDDSKDAKEQTSCAVNGIGYILCPVMGFISDAMDWIFEQIKGFLVIKPLSTDHNSALYKAWRYMLAFANMAFVIAFLIFVYSYLTGMGVSQYDIRKMIPRLIIAAILVNASYILCALFVDLSNVAGSSLQDLFITIRDQIASGDTSQNKLDGIKWSAMVAYFLSGGTIIAASVAHMSAVGTGAIYMLVPILVMVAIAMLVTITVLAARQAIIILLIIVSPLAFVAFTLPGTTKYFDKWRDLFQTMLLMFPLFSILFGGSQLAGYLIAQNATRPEVVILAMFVQIAPLIITPFLIKVSGGLLGKFAGMVNNPAKGVGDKAKNWASGKQDQHRARRLANNSMGSGIARRLDNMRLRDEAMKKRYEAKRKRNFDASNMGRNLAVQQMMEDERVAKTENLNKSAYEEMKRNDPKVRADAVQVKIAEMELNVNKAKMEAYLDELQTSEGTKMHGANDVAVRSLSNRMRKIAQEQQVTAHQAMIAGDARKTDYAKSIVESQALRKEAAGIGGTAGEMLAAARATQEIRADFGKSVDASTELLKHFGKGLSNKQLETLAYGGGGVEGVDSSGRKYTFDASGIGGAMHEAAAVKFMHETNAAGFEKFVQHVSDHQGDGYTSLNSTVKDIALKQFSTKIPYMAGKSLDLIDQGKAGASSKKGEGFRRMITQTIEGGKLGPEKLVNADAATLKQIIETVQLYNSGDKDVLRQVDSGVKFAAQSSSLIESAREALTDTRLKGSITASVRDELEILSRM